MKQWRKRLLPLPAPEPGFSGFPRQDHRTSGAPRIRGAGSSRSFHRLDSESFARELQGAETSSACPSGVRRRLAPLPAARLSGGKTTRHSGIRLNALTALADFQGPHMPVEEAVASILGSDRAAPALELLRHADTVVRDHPRTSRLCPRRSCLLTPCSYSSASPSLLDCLFVNHAVRKVPATSFPIRTFAAGRRSGVRTVLGG